MGYATSHFHPQFLLHVIIYQSIFQDSVWICLSHSQHQRGRTRRKPFFHWNLQDPLEACFVLLSGGESCLVPARILHLDLQSLVCSRPSRGRNQLSRPDSTETLSTPLRLLFGHSTHQRRRPCRGRSHKRRWIVHQLCKVQHSFSYRLQI